MAVLPAAAAAAYRAAAQSGLQTPQLSPSSAGGEFSDFLSNAVKQSVETMKAGETMAAKGIAGKADIIDVVNAVNAAEVSLSTVVAVRDKVVSAYQTIMNMPI